ncbi:hypothetical protein [Phormidium tenue]|uniref:Uncharacterized protein n=1 Tax=Phormidium tenue NIES-30 TaxID=549789 RepID=A0A1U7J0P7_9CYAN|nr:hypothetical protein [Phormidium tenue]MBD2234196.1 hypothetical protein [Phormidium tenue FACHB-1052]OKH45134.1 hypothetical protein NIES30_20360 [Phormidium tenue NIES-30]
MNASVDRANVQATALTNESALQPAAATHQALAAVVPMARETAPATADKICWLEVRQAPYHPNQQVELLHLQAEAEALLLQLQAKHQRRQRTLDDVIEPSTV